MNRIKPRLEGKINKFDLEKRVRLLTILVGLQIILLCFILYKQFQISVIPDRTRQNPQVMDSTDFDKEEINLKEIEPIVREPESGQLPPEIIPIRPVRIEVLNGCGVNRLASRYADLLRKEGYDIRDSRNADHKQYPNTLILDRTQLEFQAIRLAELMGIERTQVTTLPDPKLVDIDLTIILGKDYKNLKIKP